MKLSKKLLYTIGLIVSVGLLYTVAGMASSTPAEGEYDEDTYGPKEAMVWHKPVPRVTFSHKVHTMDAGLRRSGESDEGMKNGSALAPFRPHFQGGSRADKEKARKWRGM